MHNILSPLMGIPALKPVLPNIGNSQRNRRKSVEKLLQKRKVNLKQYETKNFFNYILFSIKKIKLLRKSVCSNMNRQKKNRLNSCFSRIFHQFLGEFSIFLKTGFSDETPINRDTILCI